LSELETQAIKKFLDQHEILGSINFHSVVGVLFPARCLNRQGENMHREMGKAFDSDRVTENISYYSKECPLQDETTLLQYQLHNRHLGENLAKR
jgi:hypothetical protein